MSSQTETEARGKHRGLALSVEQALRIAHLGWWEWCPDDDYTYWSDEMFRILGLDPEQAPPAYRTFCEAMQPEDSEWAKRTVWVCIHQHRPFQVEHRIVRADDGSVRHVRHRGEAHIDPDTGQVRYIGTIQDITEHVQADAVLQREREWFHTLINALPDTVCFKDGQGRWLLSNQQNLEVFDLQGVDYQGKTDEELQAFSEGWGPGIAQCSASDEEAWRRGEPTVFEEELRGPDGAQRLFEVTKIPLFDDDQARLGLVVIGRDITERRRAEEALLQSESELADAQQIADVGSWRWDLATGELSWSDQSYRLFGRDPAAPPPDYEELASTHLPAEDIDKLKAARRRAADSGEDRFELDHRIRRLDGQLRHAHTIGKLIRDRDGAVVRVVGVIQDVTERRKMERVKDEFVSIVSHELRTPLTPITGVLSLLARGGGGELSDRAQQMVDLALRNSQRLLYLIDDLLDVRRMSTGQMVFHFQRVQLAEVVEEALRVNRGLETQNDVTVELVDADADLWVECDRGRLIQVMTNLLTNAAKFSPAGGTVEVRVRRRDGRARVEVRDRGPGIPADFRPRVFEKFAQADSSSTRRHGGTGLGLTISKSIIERLQGHIDFETGDEGTTFFFELPLVDAP